MQAIPAKPIRRSLSPGYRRTAVLAIVQYLLVCTGVPLPAVADDLSAGPYPCQGHQCGCRTADQCWKNCCCMSQGEKLAWARANGVSPPTFVFEAALREAAVAGSSPSCCRARASCCSSPRASCTAAACRHAGPCEHGDGCDHEAACAASSPSRATGVVLVSFLAAQRCGGNSAAQWMNAPISLPPPRPLRAVGTSEDFSRLDPAAEIHRPSATFAPPDPPPRSV